jgi:hypothetical protein
MAQQDTNDEAGERLGEMVAEWAEAYWEQQAPSLRRPAGGDEGPLREAVTRAFMAGAVTVFQRWDEVRPLVPRRRVSWRDLPSHHG